MTSFPLSSWIGRVYGHRQPWNAVTATIVFAVILLCSIIPSHVAFTSLISAGGVQTIVAYGLIVLLRFTFTPRSFKSSHSYHGRGDDRCTSRLCCSMGLRLWCVGYFVFSSSYNNGRFGGNYTGLIRIVLLPGDGQPFNFACTIFCSVWIFAVFS